MRTAQRMRPLLCILMIYKNLDNDPSTKPFPKIIQRLAVTGVPFRFASKSLPCCAHITASRFESSHGDVKSLKGRRREFGWQVSSLLDRVHVKLQVVGLCYEGTFPFADLVISLFLHFGCRGCISIRPICHPRDHSGPVPWLWKSFFEEIQGHIEGEY